MTILAYTEKSYTSTNFYGIGGTITGATTDKLVLLYNRSTYAYIANTTSKNLKYAFYDMTASDTALEFFAVGLDTTKTVNASVADRAPCTVLLREFA
jgi:hypothetical protein